MRRQSLRHGLWIVLLLLAGGSGALDARAQFRSAESSSAPDTMRSLAPAPLTDDRSLDRYVRDADDLRPAGLRREGSVRYDPTLSPGQKLLWGTVGVIVHAVCDDNELTPVTSVPPSVLDVRERTCIHCERMGDRATDAVVEGLFSRNP
jgi:hypothetical protein